MDSKPLNLKLGIDQIHGILNSLCGFEEWPEDDETDLYQRLCRHLDLLAMAFHSLDYEFDSSDYPEEPQIDYQDLRDRISKKLGRLGFYKMTHKPFDLYGSENESVHDAIDDLADILKAAIEFLWRYENTSPGDAMFYFKEDSQWHLLEHVRGLQYFLLQLHLEFMGLD